MSQGPGQIRINHDEFYARLVGRTKDGRQFFITQPFIPYGHDFVACYLFDGEGLFLEAKIQDLGKRQTSEPPGNALHDNEGVSTLEQKLLDELGHVMFGDIVVSPFSHQAYGVTFGLIAQPPEEPDDDWTVIAEPGNYMAFHPPWDGEYDT